MARTIRYESDKKNDKGVKQIIRQQRKHVKNLLNVQRFNSFESEMLFEDYKY